MSAVYACMHKLARLGGVGGILHHKLLLN